MNITIADFGTGNLHSLQKAFERVGCDVEITPNPEAWLDSEVLILPGDGAFGPFMEPLHGYEEPMRKRLLERPALGICVGMQILFESSAEDPDSAGLGILPGKLERLPAPRLPHMGWNRVEHNGHELFDKIPSGEYFYFVHTYGIFASNQAIATTHYGRVFVASVQFGAASFAVQFHPEKSGQCGLKLLENYVELARVKA